MFVKNCDTSATTSLVIFIIVSVSMSFIALVEAAPFFFMVFEMEWRSRNEDRQKTSLFGGYLSESRK